MVINIIWYHRPRFVDVYSRRITSKIYQSLWTSFISMFISGISTPLFFILDKWNPCFISTCNKDFYLIHGSRSMLRHNNDIWKFICVLKLKSVSYLPRPKTFIRWYFHGRKMGQKTRIKCKTTELGVVQGDKNTIYLFVRLFSDRSSSVFRL